MSETNQLDDCIIVYSDGACSGNPGPGGWGAVLMQGDKWIQEISGFEKHTTNNRMELLAAINSLAIIKQAFINGDTSCLMTLKPEYMQNKPFSVKLYTDSTYVRSGITDWIKKWKKNNWRSGTIKNQDLWKTLDDLCQEIPVEWIWVKGHSGNHYNEIADKLACKAIKNNMR